MAGVFPAPAQRFIQACLEMSLFTARTAPGKKRPGRPKNRTLQPGLSATEVGYNKFLTLHIALPVALSTSCGCRKSGSVPRRRARTLDGVYKIQTMSADCAITIQFEVVPLGSTNSDALPEHDVSTRHKQHRQKKQNRPNCRKDIRFYCFQQ